MENPFKRMLGTTVTKDVNPDLDLAPVYREPNRQERRERRQKRFWKYRLRHRGDGTVYRDRWEWKPTQPSPQKRRDRNRRRNKMAHASRVKNR